MKSATWRAGTYVCSLAALLSAPALWATQANPVNITLEARLARRGASFIHVVNHTREGYRMSFMPGPAGTIQFRNMVAHLEPGATVDLNLGQLPFVEGTQILDVNTLIGLLLPAVRTGDGSVMPGPQLYEVLVVDPTSVRISTYEQEFLSKRRRVPGESGPTRIDFGGRYFSTRGIGALAFESTPLEKAPRFTPVDLPSPVVMADMARKQLPKFAGAQGDSEKDDDKVDRSSAREDRADRSHDRDASSAAAVGPFGGMKGQLFLKVPAPGNSVAYNPAWGWSVRAWQLFGGTSLFVGNAWVAGDGSWSLNFIFPPLPNAQVRVEYQPANRFVQVQDSNANVYTWGDNWNFNAPLTDLGFRSLNLTKTGDAPGIDKIYQAATALWRAFKNDGMNALRDEPIEMTYPNTSSSTCDHKDGNGNPAPWSCSQSGDGKIWLIAKHAVSGVVQHEIAHSIHSYYWDGNMPSGSGGDHSLTGCFNPGMALTEGFADFMPYWVQFNRNNAAPVETTNLGYNIETPGAGFCNGASNEVRVSATFWDVHDTHNDNISQKKDDWNFTQHSAAVSTFLNNPGNDSMTNYFSVYGAILGPVWTTRIFLTFTLNTMF